MVEESILHKVSLPHDSGFPKKLDHFITNLFQDTTHTYATFTFPVESMDPLIYLQQQWSQNEFYYYWENPNQQLAIAAGGETCRLSAKGPTRFSDIKGRVSSLQQDTLSYTEKSLSPQGLFFVGGFSFHHHSPNSIWNSFPAGTITVPEWAYIVKKDRSFLTVTVRYALFDTPDHLRSYLHNLLKQFSEIATSADQWNDPFEHPLPSQPKLEKPGYKAWLKSVKKAKDLISGKKFEKIVLARKLSLPYQNVQISAILNTLRRQYPACYNFLMHQPSGDTFLGSTPERLGSVRRNSLYTEALAGSIRRGNTLSEDFKLGKELSQSAKNLNEHDFVVKDIEEQLKSISPRVWRQTQPKIKKLSTVQHLYTALRARLDVQTNILEVIEKLHPTPAVGGYPWKNASPYVKNLEKFDRGWYAAPIGWFDANGDGDFAVAIRSSLISKNEAHFFAGCGIVADSKPHEEWEETNLKLKPMLSAFYED